MHWTPTGFVPMDLDNDDDVDDLIMLAHDILSGCQQMILCCQMILFLQNNDEVLPSDTV